MAGYGRSDPGQGQALSEAVARGARLTGGLVALALQASDRDRERNA